MLFQKVVLKRGPNVPDEGPEYVWVLELTSYLQVRIHSSLNFLINIEAHLIYKGCFSEMPSCGFLKIQI
jgi:hypothetical protein